LDRPLNGEVTGLGDLIDIESIEGNIIRYRADQPLATNPKLVQRLTAMGLGVVSLQEIPQSLEDVYLRVVGVAPEPTPQPPAGAQAGGDR
jgi:hypothetical protein